jgi:hypothetical protein
VSEHGGGEHGGEHGGGEHGGEHGGGERGVPYVCPFCGEEDLRPAESGRWHCRSCLRLFSLTFHGVTAAGSPYPQPAPATSAPPPPTPAAGIRLVDPPIGGDTTVDDDPAFDDDPADDRTTPGSIP